MTRNQALELLNSRRAEIQHRFGVRTLAVFGSVARDQARADSDVDVLVVFEGRPRFDPYMELKEYLEGLFGVRVDLVTWDCVRPEMRRKSNEKPSMSRDWRLYLGDIVTSCEKIRRFTAGMSRESFLADERTVDAVVRNIEIIGIAAKRIPDEIRAQVAGVEWTKIAGMRDVIAHEYFRVSPDILWDVVENKIGELESAVAAFLKA